MTDTITVDYTLTTVDARALRNATTICFDHHPDGTGCIRAILSAERSETGFEQTRVIHAESSRVEDYEPHPSNAAYSGFVWMGSAQHDDVTRTLTRRLLRKGTTFELHWVRGNSSPVTREAGLVVDYLKIVVVTNGSRETYLLHTSVSLDNTARMIRRAGVNQTS